MENKEITMRQAIGVGAKVSFVWLALPLVFLLSQSNPYNDEDLFIAIMLGLFGILGGIFGALGGYTIRKPKYLTVISIWAIGGAVLIGMGCSLLVAIMVLPE